MTVILSAATGAFLEEINRELGAAWFRKLTAEIIDGTFTHVGGELCLVEVDAASSVEPRRPQLRLGEEAA